MLYFSLYCIYLTPLINFLQIKILNISAAYIVDYTAQQ